MLGDTWGKVGSWPLMDRGFLLRWWNVVDVVMGCDDDYTLWIYWNHWITDFKRMNCVICELFLNKDFFKKKKRKYTCSPDTHSWGSLCFCLHSFLFLSGSCRKWWFSVGYSELVCRSELCIEWTVISSIFIGPSFLKPLSLSTSFDPVLYPE